MKPHATASSGAHLTAFDGFSLLKDVTDEGEVQGEGGTLHTRDQ